MASLRCICAAGHEPPHLFAADDRPLARDGSPRCEVALPREVALRHALFVEHAASSSAPDFFDGFPIGHWCALIGALRDQREIPLDAVDAIEAWRAQKPVPPTATARTDARVGEPMELHEKVHELLQCALAWEPGARLLGNIAAWEIERICLAMLDLMDRRDEVVELLRWEAQQRDGVAPQAAEHFAFVAEFLAARSSSPPVQRRFGAARGSVVYESPDAWDPDDRPPDGYFARSDNYICGLIHGAWVVQGTSFEDAVGRRWAHKRNTEAGHDRNDATPSTTSHPKSEPDERGPWTAQEVSDGLGALALQIEAHTQLGAKIQSLVTRLRSRIPESTPTPEPADDSGELEDALRSCWSLCRCQSSTYARDVCFFARLALPDLGSEHIAPRGASRNVLVRALQRCWSACCVQSSGYALEVCERVESVLRSQLLEPEQGSPT